MSSSTFPLLMFAAGFGTRMKALTLDRPKPLIKVADKPLINHALTLAKDAGCDPIVANLHYMADMVTAHLDTLGVQTITESPEILETGGGLRNALPLLGKGPVVTSNTDAVWAGPNPITALLSHWNPSRMDALLICIPKSQAVGHEGPGDFMLSSDGQITRGPGAVYGGVQILKTDLLHDIPEPKFSLNRVWDMMLENGRLYGLSYTGHWCDVGHPEGINMAEDMLRHHSV